MVQQPFVSSLFGFAGYIDPGTGVFAGHPMSPNNTTGTFRERLLIGKLAVGTVDGAFDLRNSFIVLQNPEYLSELLKN